MKATYYVSPIRASESLLVDSAWLSLLSLVSLHDATNHATDS